MKSILISYFCILNIFIFPQDFQRGGPDPQRRINQLEKVKLLEELELDDQTAIKFFNLRDLHQQKMMDLRDRSDNILDSIQETLASGDSKRGSSLNKLLVEYRMNEEELFSLRKSFLADAENVLAPEKYAKFLVFERNFREEMRKVLMDHRKQRRMKPE